MLRIEGISKSFAGNQVISAVSLRFPAGAITALVGPNGAGKTTLFDLVSGFVGADAGALFLAGEPISALDPYSRARKGISRTFQQVKLAENLTILDHFEMLKDFTDERLLAAFLAAPAATLSGTYVRFLDTLGLHKPLETRVADLSYGQRKLLDFGCAVFRPHLILLLDEPVAGVNPVIRKHIHALVKGLKEKGETVVLIEHDIEFVRGLADRVVVLDEGAVLIEGEPNQVFADPRVMEAYLGK